MAWDISVVDDGWTRPFSLCGSTAFRCIIGGLEVEVTRLYDDVERISAIGNLTIETGFALIKIIEE